MIISCAKIKKHGREYFKMGVWSFVDIILLALALVCIVFDIYRQIEVSTTLESLLSEANVFFNLDFLCYWTVQFNTTIAFMTFISWLKIFKYTSFNKTMSSLSMTLNRCASDVAGFAVMFFIVFLAYAQLGYLVFGTQVGDFFTFEQSM